MDAILYIQTAKEELQDQVEKRQLEWARKNYPNDFHQGLPYYVTDVAG